MEKYPGQAKRWFFHLPALGPNGTIIRLVSGIILAWDGREVLHCTGMSPDGAGADNAENSKKVHIFFPACNRAFIADLGSKGPG